MAAVCVFRPSLVSNYCSRFKFSAGFQRIRCLITIDKDETHNYSSLHASVCHLAESERSAKLGQLPIRRTALFPTPVVYLGAGYQSLASFLIKDSQIRTFNFVTYGVRQCHNGSFKCSNRRRRQFAQQKAPENGEMRNGLPSSAKLAGSAKHKLDETRQKFRTTREKVKEKVEGIIQKENVLTVPNILCVSRILVSPVLAFLVLEQSYEYALGLFVFAGLTDLLDGFIARNFENQKSMFGSFLDPMADKFLVFFLIISLTANDLIPVPLTALILSRDALLFAAGFYIRYVSLPPPKTLSRYFDVTLATARLSPTFTSKINTTVQLALVACTLASPIFQLEGHFLLQGLWYLTAATTAASALSYAVSKETYQIMKEIKQKK